MDKDRETFVYIAKLAEQAERYDEMLDSMKNVAKLDVELTVEERNLLSVGYMNVIGARRASWRILSSIEQNEEGNDHSVKKIKEYRQMVETEITEICNDIMTVIDEHLTPSSAAGESTVFYYTMKGDYYRNLAEFKAGNDRKEVADLSLKAYEVASTAAADLSPTHSIRLGLALKFSVFYYEIMKSPERACHLAKQAVDEAISELDTLSEDSYKESNLIMQLLRDNLTLWRSDNPEDGGMGDLQMEQSKKKAGNIILSGEECLEENLTQATKQLEQNQERRVAGRMAQHRVNLQDQAALDKLRAEEMINKYKSRAKHEDMLIDRKNERGRVRRSDKSVDKKGR